MAVERYSGKCSKSFSVVKVVQASEWNVGSTKGNDNWGAPCTEAARLLLLLKQFRGYANRKRMNDREESMK